MFGLFLGSGTQLEHCCSRERKDIHLLALSGFQMPCSLYRRKRRSPLVDKEECPKDKEPVQARFCAWCVSLSANTVLMEEECSVCVIQNVPLFCLVVFPLFLEL